ncbi:type II toxin-antitoxin system RelE/ParE family toxin [Chromatiaceae bacterium AAb-1]|nr:type II toxin-antitoxin system RelE/ParE family toxin [Chromatiaceae bacterium AAb-1]
MRYQLTPRAYADLISIGHYTQQKWGKTQRDDYINALVNRFDWLAQQPGIGKSRSEVAPGYFSFVHAEHVIFYIKQPANIAIIGVVHRRADPESHFSL